MSNESSGGKNILLGIRTAADMDVPTTLTINSFYYLRGVEDNKFPNQVPGMYASMWASLFLGQIWPDEWERERKRRSSILVPRLRIIFLPTAKMKNRQRIFFHILFFPLPDWRSMATLPNNSHFQTFQNESIYDSELHRISRSTGFGALKLWNVRSGKRICRPCSAIVGIDPFSWPDQLPDETIRNCRALKSGDWQILLSSRASIHEYWGSKNVISSVRCAAKRLWLLRWPKPGKKKI